MLKLKENTNGLNYDTSSFRTWIVLALFLIQIILIQFPIIIKLPFKHNRKKLEFQLNYSTSPIITSVLLLATTSISIKDFSNGIIGSPNSIQPLSVLVLIFSLAYICISLDHTGIFSYLALVISKWSSKSIRLFFVAFFLFTVVVGAIASNDVVILTLTPLICYLSKALNIDPLPFFIGEFIGANTASLALYVGNPTNVVISMAYNISFLNYSQLLSLPFLFSIVIELIVLLMIFWNRLSNNVINIEVNPKELLIKPVTAIFGSVILILCLITLIICSVWHVEVWITTLPFGLIMVIWDVVYDLKYSRRQTEQCVILNQINNGTLKKDNDLNNNGSIKSDGIICKKNYKSDIDCLDSIVNYSKSVNIISLEKHEPSMNKEMEIQLYNEGSSDSNNNKYSEFLNRFASFISIIKNLPWGLLPFLLGMFIMVEAMHVRGFTTLLAQTIINVLPSNVYAFGFGMSILTTLLCALLNNLPTSILLARTLIMIDFSNEMDRAVGAVAFMAIIICCNLGANTTPAGSLAGLMWKGILLRKEMYIGSLTLFKYCLIITPLTIVIATLIAILQTFIFPNDLFNILY
ncbi:hypothetical protein K502DRAFT_342641 [Neoconidiobolus thromboides FSU 785]|nr:hypothetical protein K502DRAFT_342641 [Neoconidiobolus thromboides FSU 785]